MSIGLSENAGSATGVLLAQIDPLVNGAGSVLLSQGVLGVAVVGLVYFVMVLRAELRDLRAVHKTELAAKDALILELQEKRLASVLAGAELAKQMRDTLEALLTHARH